ncbi:MAG: response regulator transcription factor [Lachnospiraceae bacterium]
MESSTIPHILVAESDSGMSSLILSSLTREGFTAEAVKSGADVMRCLQDTEPDLITLELTLPDIDGVQLIRRIRLKSQVPILVITTRSDIRDKLAAFAAGADDYLTKPFDTREMVARVTVILRRLAGYTPEDTAEGAAAKTVNIPDLAINLENYQVSFQGRPVDLSPREIELLYFLASHPNQVFSREQLLDQVWGREFAGDYRTIDTHIRKIRKKITGGPNWSIQTVWGVGYKFELTETI